MDDWVAEDVIRQAIADANANGRLGSAEQWAAVQSYVEERGADPWPARRLRLQRGHTSSPRVRLRATGLRRGPVLGIGVTE